MNRIIPPAPVSIPRRPVTQSKRKEFSGNDYLTVDQRRVVKANRERIQRLLWNRKFRSTLRQIVEDRKIKGEG